jgi:hypothetical protein
MTQYILSYVSQEEIAQNSSYIHTVNTYTWRSSFINIFYKNFSIILILQKQDLFYSVKSIFTAGRKLSLKFYNNGTVS